MSKHRGLQMQKRVSGQDEIESLKTEVARLTRENERLRDMGSALAGDGGIADKYQQERDQWRALAERQADEVTYAYQAALRHGDFADKRFDETVKLLTLAGNEAPQPQIIEAVVWALDESETIYAEQQAQLFRDCYVPANAQPDARRFFSHTLIAAIRLREISQMRIFAYAVLFHVYSLSNDPRLVCDQIDRELRISSRVRMRTLERLGPDWFKDKLDGPAKLETVKDYLDCHAEWRAAGGTMQVFSRGDNALLKKVQRGERLRKEITAVGRTLPDQIQRAVEEYQQKRLKGDVSKNCPVFVQSDLP